MLEGGRTSGASSPSEREIKLLALRKRGGQGELLPLPACGCVVRDEQGRKEGNRTRAQLPAKKRGRAEKARKFAGVGG